MDQSLQSVKPATLPGYNRNLRSTARPSTSAPANRNRASNPTPGGQSVRTAPNNRAVQRPAPQPMPRPMRPAPEPVRPANKPAER